MTAEDTRVIKAKNTEKRILGTYEGKAQFTEKDDGKITLEEFLAIEGGLRLELLR